MDESTHLTKKSSFKMAGPSMIQHSETTGLSMFQRHVRPNPAMYTLCSMDAMAKHSTLPSAWDTMSSLQLMISSWSTQIVSAGATATRLMTTRLSQEMAWCQKQSWAWSNVWHPLALRRAKLWLNLSQEPYHISSSDFKHLTKKIHHFNIDKKTYYG